jgi:hypothetical protein
MALPTGHPASTSQPAPVVTIPPVLPLPSEAVSDKDRDKAWARKVHEQWAPHFGCRDYPDDGLRWQDLIPTANVSARIAFDRRTGSNEVVTVDPRIVISHHVFMNRVKLAPGASWKTVAQDTYRWTYAPGTEHFTVYLYGSVAGKPRWHRIDPSFDLEPDKHGIYEMSLGRGKAGNGILIVATDTTTCRPGNPLPKELWKDLGYDAR